ncbi:sulfotransferase domain-containing protein [Sphingomonas sp. BN140010]|uniref:Sulfotransferase domain-containing protein n=1 Tax=Sphingomonas arvum TaxID=2992113 RepID=A0ABT3JAU2_9SPHN|nr:sulfotransferase domain-containing protein [Sphingomonas sp. BN140010]MCW3796194.1 sulfotransferase domain-containing protein [Sphingomonas sp. BN140010]
MSKISPSHPDFIYIGTSKAGSTWHFKVLSWHPEIYMYPGKDLGFFSGHFEKGREWYLNQFKPKPPQTVVGEVSHTYLVHPDAPRRIAQHLPHLKMLICLRDPVQRTFSDYLDGVKNGKFTESFEAELARNPGLIDRSRYGTHFQRYLQRFERSQFHIGCFDELATAPRQYAQRMYQFLGVDALEIPGELTRKVLPAGEARSAVLAETAKRLSRFARRTGLDAVRGRMKTSEFVRNVLYRPFDGSSRPRMERATEVRLRDLFAEEVQLFDELAGTDLSAKWNYWPISDRRLTA